MCADAPFNGYEVATIKDEGGKEVKGYIWSMFTHGTVASSDPNEDETKDKETGSIDDDTLGDEMETYTQPEGNDFEEGENTIIPE